MFVTGASILKCSIKTIETTAIVDQKILTFYQATSFFDASHLHGNTSWSTISHLISNANIWLIHINTHTWKVV